jgi:hypothetical protein
MLAMLLVFGMTVVEVGAQNNNGGEFILTNIPAKYNGYYVMGVVDDEVFAGDNPEVDKPSRIIDGKVILPLWVEKPNGKWERYTGNFDNDSVYVELYVIDKDDNLMDIIHFTEYRPKGWSRGEIDNSVKFPNGRATRSYNDRN